MTTITPPTEADLAEIETAIKYARDVNDHVVDADYAERLLAEVRRLNLVIEKAGLRLIPPAGTQLKGPFV